MNRKQKLAVLISHFGNSMPRAETARQAREAKAAGQPHDAAAAAAYDRALHAVALAARRFAPVAPEPPGE